MGNESLGLILVLQPTSKTGSAGKERFLACRTRYHVPGTFFGTGHSQASSYDFSPVYASEPCLIFSAVGEGVWLWLFERRCDKQASGGKPQ
jgi:hypothetical protein